MKKLITISVLLVIVLGCESGESTLQIHPLAENIPYKATENVVNIESPENKFVSESPEELELFESFNKNLNPQFIKSHSIPNADLSNSKFEALSDEHIILLSKSSNLFVENIGLGDNWKEISGEGRGPGEIFFPTDLHRVENKLYISSKNYRISIYDCIQNQECNYEKTVSLNKIQPNVLVADRDNFVILGLGNEFMEAQDAGIGVINPIHEINAEGDILNTYGEFYDVDNEFMLLQPFENGFLDHVELNGSNVLAKAFEAFPSLVLIENKEVLKRYDFEDFKNSKREFNTQTKELFINFEDWSVINDITSVGEGKVIVQIRNLKDREVTEYGTTWAESEDVYLINIQNDETSYLGSYDYKKFMLKFSSQYMLIVEDDKLSHYKIEF